MKHCPLRNCIIIKVDKNTQKDRKEKKGNLYLHTNFIWMTRNCQAGEIVAVHPELYESFPEAVVGATAIVHHFVEGVPEKHFLYSDEQYHYYSVSGKETPGKVNEVYAVYHNGKIIPHQDFIFLYNKKGELQSVTESEENGIISVSNKQSRSEVERKMAKTTLYIQNQAKAKMTEERKKDILRKEAYVEELSQSINRQFVDYYNVVAINPSLNKRIKESFGFEIEPNETICCMNFGCLTEVEFNGIEYIIGLSKYFYCPASWAEICETNFREELLLPKD